MFYISWEYLYFAADKRLYQYVISILAKLTLCCRLLLVRMPEYSSLNTHYFLYSIKLNWFYNSHGVFSARYEINIRIYA